MSEASRQRRLFLENVLREIESRIGPPDGCMPDWLDGADVDPSWGPVGSLAERLLAPDDFGHVLAQTDEMNQVERSARMARGDATRPVSPPAPAQPSTAPLAQKRVLSASEAMLQLDHYGETALYACPECGEESAKANLRIQLWHCTACEAWGHAERPGPKVADW